jgi:C4-dicarboxylate-specific signal transduction histidine kinase
VLDDVLGTLAQSKEWGLLIFLTAAFAFLTKYLAKAVAEQQRINGEREERLLQAMLAFGETIPKLAASIDELRGWLAERFNDLNEDLGAIKRDQVTISATVVNHEGRIVKLENGQGSEPGVRQ